MRLEPAVALLIDHGYSGAPVIDAHGHLSGMLHARPRTPAGCMRTDHPSRDRPYPTW
jgi:hypothetical protein